MKKVNCYRCDYVSRPTEIPMNECQTEDLCCCHPFVNGGVRIDGITICPKSIR